MRTTKIAPIIAVLLGCTFVKGGNLVTGLITPEHFQFQELVPLSGPEGEAGGWRAACILAAMRDGRTGAKVICEFEVGTPIKTQKQGWIVVRDAQRIAAATANEAAYAVLSKPGVEAMIGTACGEFIRLFDAAIRVHIAGARVRSSCDPRLQPVHFDQVQ